MLSDLDSISGNKILLNLEPNRIRIADWLLNHSREVDEILNHRGALLIRGLGVRSNTQFARVLMSLFASELLPYNHRSTPRTALKDNIYTATEYRADQEIVQHNEQAYTNVWPMRIGFYCQKEAEVGGETPIADSRQVYENMPASIRDEFEKRSLMYIRNFSDIDLPWQEVYQTSSKDEVAHYCKQNGIVHEWVDENHLRTKQVLPASRVHPVAKVPVWFNQAHLFHASAIGESLSLALKESRGLENLPRNVCYGDGEAIPDDVIMEIRRVYDAYKVSFRWERGDVLLLDNMLFSHGREAFEGERSVLTGMARSSQEYAWT